MAQPIIAYKFIRTFRNQVTREYYRMGTNLLVKDVGKGKKFTEKQILMMRMANVVLPVRGLKVKPKPVISEKVKAERKLRAAEARKKRAIKKEKEAIEKANINKKETEK